MAEEDGMDVFGDKVDKAIDIRSLSCILKFHVSVETLLLVLLFIVQYNTYIPAFYLPGLTCLGNLEIHLVLAAAEYL